MGSLWGRQLGICSSLCSTTLWGKTSGAGAAGAPTPAPGQGGLGDPAPRGVPTRRGNSGHVQEQQQPPSPLKSSSLLLFCSPSLTSALSILSSNAAEKQTYE